MNQKELKVVEDLVDALNSCINDLDAWASSGPEGFTKDEAKRFKRYNVAATRGFNLVVKNQPKG